MARSPRIKSLSNVKTRRQARFWFTERTESKHSVADHRQSPRAACPRRRPRVANALIAQATTRLNAALTPPAPTRAIPRPDFAFPGLSSSPQQQPSASSLRRRHSRAQARDEPSILHRSSTTSSPAAHCLLPCPLIALGKCQRRAQAHRSSVATSIAVATSPPSTAGHASALDSSAVAR